MRSICLKRRSISWIMAAVPSETGFGVYLVVLLSSYISI